MSRLLDPLFAVVRVGVFVLAGVSALGIVTMMTVTCADVILRILGSSLTGAVDLVTLAGGVTVACALPYTTAVKGHVAIEYFFHKLPPRRRVGVDSVLRVFLTAAFCIVCRECIRYGNKLRASGHVSMTLEIPLYWLAWVIAASSGMVALVVLYHLLHPGKEMIKP